MTLSIVVEGPEGLVFATDSRTTGDWPLPDGSKEVTLYQDTTHKLFTFDKPHSTIAAVATGIASFEGRTLNSLMSEFEAELAFKGRLSVQSFANHMSTFFKKKWDEEPKTASLKDEHTEFLVGGFDKKGDKKGKSSRVYYFSIPNELKPREMSAGVWMIGQSGIASRLVHGYDVELPELLTNALSLTDKQVELMNETLKRLQLPFPWEAFGLQSYVDVAMLYIRTTIDVQKLTVCERMCGGPIDVATITRKEGLRIVRCKEIEAELC